MGKKPAFTLIELLVVIAAIALLMAILVPALQGARKRARAVVCRVYLKQWGTTLALYLEDREGRFARSADLMPGLSLLRGVYINLRTDPNALKRYHAVETRDISCCPMATRTTGSMSFGVMKGGQFFWEMSSGGTFLAWEIQKPTPAFRGSYGINRNLFSPSMFVSSDTPAGGSTQELDIYALKQCGAIPVLLDATSPNAWMTRADEPPPKWEPFGSNSTVFALLSDTDLCINRHNGTMNALFLDWSVRPVGLKELWTLKWHGKFDTAGPWTKAGGVKPEDWPQWMRKFKDY